MSFQRPKCYRVSRGIAAILCAGLLSAAGCQSVNTELSQLFGDIPPTSAVAAESPPAADTPKFRVELRADGRKPEVITVPLTGPIYIQQALDQSGASRRFPKMKIELYRQLPDGGGHRLDIAFDRAKHQVPAGSDYAVHPNDRIVATEDTSTIIDDMLGSLGEKFTN